MYDHNRIKNHISGVESCSYELFGAHIENGGVSFSVYAPGSSGVKLIASHNNWEEIPMQRDVFGVWTTFVPGIGEGTVYKYRIYTQDGQYTDKADPFAYYSEVRPKNASIVYDINNYYWRDNDWVKSRNKNFTNPLNIYEVHLGSWRVKDDKEGDDKLYRYEELIDVLIPYAKEMGYTHIEFMPLTEYPYDGSWGYQVSGFYAPTSRYGEPRYLMKLVDECHLNGIGAIFDFVPVHFARDEFGLSYFDGTCLYGSEIPQFRESVWGSIRFDYSKPHVHSFVRSAINFWINQYHFDGIRLDAVAYLMYPDGSPNSPEYDCGIWFLKNSLFTLNAYHHDVMFIAEDSTCRLKDTAPVVYGGMGFDYAWDFGWSSETLRYMTIPYSMRPQNHAVMTYPMYYYNQQLFILSISHDDVSGGKQSEIARFYGKTQEEKFANLRTYYMYQMTHPGKKLNFMGNELAEFMEWKGDNPLGWNLLTYPNHDSYHEFVKALNRIYREEPALYSQDYNMSAFAWVDMQNANDNIYAYRRDDFNGHPLFAVLNFSPNEHDYWLAVGYDGFFRELISTDTDIYGGSNNRNYELKSNEGYLHIKLAPLSGVIIKPCAEDEIEIDPAKLAQQNAESKEESDSLDDLTDLDFGDDSHAEEEDAPYDNNI